MAARAYPVGMGEYDLLRELGKGAYGRVFLGKHRPTGRVSALKLFKREVLDASPAAWEQVVVEVKAMELIRHQHVLSLISYGDQGYPHQDGRTVPVFSMELELAPGGDLFDLLYYATAFDERVARSFFRQALDGLNWCHTNKVAHRDLKPDNLLLDQFFNLKIADFGLASKNDERCYCVGRAGTEKYMAPEVLVSSQATPYDGFKADIFSLGVILFVMLAQNPPFELANQKDWYYAQIIKGKHDLFWAAHFRSSAVKSALDGAANQGLRVLLMKMLAPNPEDRPSLVEIATNPWIAGPIMSPVELSKYMQSKLAIVKDAKARDEAKIGDLELDFMDRGAEDESIDLPPLPASVCFTRITTGIKPALVLRIVKAMVTAARPSDWADAKEPVVEGAHLTADVASDLSIDVQLHQSSNPDHCVVEVKKLRGDMFAFRNLFGKLQSHLTEAAFQEINIQKVIQRDEMEDHLEELQA